MKFIYYLHDHVSTFFFRGGGGAGTLLTGARGDARGGGAGGWTGEIYILSQVRRVTDLHTLATSSLCLCGILFWISRLLL